MPQSRDDEGPAGGVVGMDFGAAALAAAAERLLHLSPVPGLLARNLSRPAPQRILVAVDESSSAAEALEWAAALARRAEAQTTKCGNPPGTDV